MEDNIGEKMKKLLLIEFFNCYKFYTEKNNWSR